MYFSLLVFCLPLVATFLNHCTKAPPEDSDSSVIMSLMANGMYLLTYNVQ